MSGERVTHAQLAAMGATAGDKAPRGELVPLEAQNALDAIYGDTPPPADPITTTEHAFGILTWCAAIDRIPRGELEAEAWLSTLQGLSMDECRRAVTEHYRRSTFEIRPANIIRIIEEGLE